MSLEVTHMNTKTVTIRMKTETYDQIKMFSKESDRSISWLLNAAVKDYINTVNNAAVLLRFAGQTDRRSTVVNKATRRMLKEQVKADAEKEQAKVAAERQKAIAASDKGTR